MHNNQLRDCVFVGVVVAFLTISAVGLVSQVSGTLT